MIQRIVLIKLTDAFATPEGRRAAAEESRRRLAEVPGPVRLDVAVPADVSSAGSWDLAITLDFAAIEDVPTYIADPIHRAFVDGFIKPKQACLKAWNFERP